MINFCISNMGHNAIYNFGYLWGPGDLSLIKLSLDTAA